MVRNWGGPFKVEAKVPNESKPPANSADDEKDGAYAFVCDEGELRKFTRSVAVVGYSNRCQSSCRQRLCSDLPVVQPLL